MATASKQDKELAALGDNLAEDAGIETKSEERVRIILEENENIAPGGQFFGVNGKGYMLRPGEEADVPLSVIEVLDNAIMSTPVMNAEQSIVGYRDRLRFPYRVIHKGGARA